MALLKHERSMGWGEAYLYGLGWLLTFVGGVFAYRAASGLYDRLFSGKGEGK
jgi:hypothetical protein